MYSRFKFFHIILGYITQGYVFLGQKNNLVFTYQTYWADIIASIDGESIKKNSKLEILRVLCSKGNNIYICQGLILEIVESKYMSNKSQ